MKNYPLVSVVIPIYNVEKYLNRCINSVVSQTYKNLEIFLVDDGSQDNCPQICDDWKEKDRRIRVIHKANEGLGLARNTGIENAIGDYICFFDSDDYIHENTIEKAVKKLINDGSQIVLFGFSTVNQNETIIEKRIPNPPQNIYVNQEIENEFLPNLIAPDIEHQFDWGLYMSACMTLISMQLINNTHWRFVSERDIISEDVYSLLKLYKYVESVSIINEPLYFYTVNNSSLTRRFRPDRFKKIKKFYDDTFNLCDESCFNDSIKERLIQPFMSFSISALKQIAASELSFSEKKILLKEIIQDDEIQHANNYLKRKKSKLSRRVFYHVLESKSVYAMYCLLKVNEWK